MEGLESTGSLTPSKRPVGEIPGDTRAQPCGCPAKQILSQQQNTTWTCVVCHSSRTLHGLVLLLAASFGFMYFSVEDGYLSCIVIYIQNGAMLFKIRTTKFKSTYMLLLCFVLLFMTVSLPLQRNIQNTRQQQHDSI